MTRFEIEQKIREREEAEYKMALADIQAICTTISGPRFLKYLFKTLNVGHLPEQGLEGNILHEALGFHRAGKSIFDLVNQANNELAATLLAQKEKELYAITLLETSFIEPDSE